MHQIKEIDFLHICLQFLHSQIRSVGYILERREGIDIKGKGIMDTYFLNGVSNDFDPGRNRCFANDHETTPQRTQLNHQHSQGQTTEHGIVHVLFYNLAQIFKVFGFFPKQDVV